MKITTVSDEAFAKMDSASRQQIINSELEKLIAGVDARQQKIEELWKQAEISAKKIADLVRSIYAASKDVAREMDSLQIEQSKISADLNALKDKPREQPKMSFWDKFKK